MGEIIEFRPNNDPQQEFDDTVTALTSAEYWLMECLARFDEGTVDRTALHRALECVYAVHDGFLTTWELKEHGVVADRWMRPKLDIDKD